MNASVEQGNVIITFDLTPKESVQERFTIEIYSSKDNYQIPLKVKEGKVRDVRPGNSLLFILDAKENFAGFQGELDFDVRATLTFSPVKFIEPFKDMTYKKGDFVRIAWRGGVENDQYAISLYKGRQQVTYINELANQNDYLWNMPKGTKPGKYHFELESNADKKMLAQSYQFVIKRKIPIVVKVLPLFALGVGTYFILSDNSGVSEASGSISNPPDPPGI